MVNELARYTVPPERVSQFLPARETWRWSRSGARS